ARGAEAAERGGERRLEVRAAAGEVLGDVEGAVLLHLVPLARVQVEGEERRVGGREADEAEEPALAPGDLEERQGDGLRPDLLLALHRPRPVEADDHRPPPALVDAAQGIGEEAALDQPAGEVAAEERVAEGEELGRQEPLEVAAEPHVEDLLAQALERPLAQRERLLAHPADHRGELPELRVRREPPAELDLPAGRGAAAAAEPRAPAARLLARLRELAGDAGGRGGQRGTGAQRHLAEPLGHVLPLLPEPRRRHLGRVLDLLTRLGRLLGAALLRQPLQALEVGGTAAHLLLLALELEEIEQVTAGQETFFAEQREHLLADEQRPETRLALVELRALAQVLEERVVAEGLEQRAVERARARHLVHPPPPG